MEVTSLDDVEKLIQRELGATELTPVVLSLPASKVVPRVVETIKAIVMRHPGQLPMQVLITNGSSATLLELPVTVSDSVRGELRAMFGRNACDP